MLELIRISLWKILGINYYKYLKNKKHVHLTEVDWATTGEGTYDNGAYVWRWNVHSKITIGNYCSIANDVHFIADSGYHNESPITTFPIFHELLDKKDSVTINGKQIIIENITSEVKPLKQNILIGNDVWIGSNVTILPGVQIGNGVTILAGAVVSENISDYAVVGGVPAKILKYKHDANIILKLNKIAWWEWHKSKIKVNANDFYLSVDEFITKHDHR